MDLSDVLKYLADNWFNIAVTAFTAVSGIIAYLTWKDSRRGPEIQLITPTSSETTAYTMDVIHNPGFNEIIIRGPGLKALFPADALTASEECARHYDEGYRGTRDVGWVRLKLRGYKKIREEPP